MESKLLFCKLDLLRFSKTDKKKKDSELNGSKHSRFVAAERWR
jgi:hypothetical protein